MPAVEECCFQDRAIAMASLTYRCKLPIGRLVSRPTSHLDPRGQRVEEPEYISLEKPNVDLAFTGERYTTSATGEIRHEHYHRYLFALQFCRGKSVLDIACGEGYGSALIGRVAAQVTGVDIASDAVRHAAESYGTDNVSFALGECADIPVADGSVDVVVSFETLEHVAEQSKFLREIKRVLRPEGILVLSTPNTDVYKEILTEPNPFHVKELDQTEFRSILGENFANFRLFGQRSVVGSAIAPQVKQLGKADAQQTFIVKDKGNISAAPGIGAPMYFIAVASDAQLPEILHGLLDDRPFLMELYALLQERAINVLRAEHEARASEALRSSAVRALEEERAVWKAKLDHANVELAEARVASDSLKTELEQANVELAEARAATELAEDRVGASQSGG